MWSETWARYMDNCKNLDMVSMRVEEGGRNIGGEGGENMLLSDQKVK